MLALENTGSRMSHLARQEIYFGRQLGVDQLLDAIEAVAGRPVPHRVVARRAGDPVATYSDTSKSEQLLRWRAEYGLPEIVETAFRWHERQFEREQASAT